LARYKEKAKCVVEQFNGFLVKQVGLHLNGQNGQGENIADIAGNLLAYKAYGKRNIAFFRTLFSKFSYVLGYWLDRHGEEPSLPGLPYSNRQMFWLAKARSTCAKDRDDRLKQSIITGKKLNE